jgi:hypothetical protein
MIDGIAAPLEIRASIARIRDAVTGDSAAKRKEDAEVIDRKVNRLETQVTCSP